jgi:predicted aspartyl protease
MGYYAKHLSRPLRKAAMETATVGKVIVQVMIQNLNDLFNVEQGTFGPDQVRSVAVQDALVDTGATTLSLPKRLITQLGLNPFRSRQARTSGGTVTLQIYGIVRLTVQGRDWHGDVAEIPDDCPVLIGQLCLEGLDFVVDPVGQRLIGNPAHGGEHIIELY